MARTPWESYNSSPILRGNFVARGQHKKHPCIAPGYVVYMEPGPSGDVALRGEFIDVFRELRDHLDIAWTPAAETLLGNYDACVRRYQTDAEFRAQMSEYDARIVASAAMSEMGLVGGGLVDERVHRVRLCFAQHQIEQMHMQTGASAHALRLLRLFMDMHLLSHLSLCADPHAPEWRLARPCPWRLPWYGHLPDMSADIVADGDFLVLRRDKTSPRADYVMLFINKMIPHPCASRNSRQKIEKLCCAYPEVMDVVLDAVLILLLGNYPGVRADYTPSFRAKAWVVARMREIAAWPYDRTIDWMARNSQLVFLAVKTMFRLNLQRLPAVWKHYATYYQYEAHFSTIERAAGYARETIDRRVRDHGWPAALDFEGEEVATFSAFHTISTLSFCKLRKGSFMHTIMYMRMRGHLMHAQKCIDGAPNCEKHRANLSNLLAFVGNARSVFWTPGKPYPLFAPDLVEVLDRFAIYQATRHFDWPCAELLEFVGADRKFLARLHLFFVMYETDDTPDNSCDKYVRQMMNEFPRECMMIFYIQERVHYIRSVCVVPLPPHVHAAQRDAVRRRYHVSPSAPTPPYATRFMACRACQRVYNFLADPSRRAKCKGVSVDGEMRLDKCGSKKFHEVDGRYYCCKCGKPSPQQFTDNEIMGVMNIKNQNWALRSGDRAMICLRCDSELLEIEGLGRAVFFRGVRYQLCSRCGAWTTYSHDRDTSYGVHCGCDTRPPPTGCVVHGDADVDALAGPGTGFECLVCYTEMTRETAARVVFLREDGGLEFRHACQLHSQMPVRLWDVRIVREMQTTLTYDRKGAMTHTIKKK